MTKAGRFTARVPLPPRLLPARYLIRVRDVGTTTPRLGTRDRLATLAAPKEGVVLRSVMSTTPGGRSEKSGETLYRDKVRKFDAMLNEIQEGPMRLATFIEMAPTNGDAPAKAFVALDDGTQACAIIPPGKPLPALRLGDRVMVDGKARVLFHPRARPD